MAASAPDGQKARHIARDDHHLIDRRVEGGETRSEARERAFERDRIVGHADSGGHNGVGVGRGDDDDVGRDGADGVDGVVEQRPAVDQLGQLVAPEPRRPAAGEHDRADPVGHGTDSVGRGAFGPGT
jgi:hypothetical protein